MKQSGWVSWNSAFMNHGLIHSSLHYLGLCLMVLFISGPVLTHVSRGCTWEIGQRSEVWHLTICEGFMRSMNSVSFHRRVLGVSTLSTVCQQVLTKLHLHPGLGTEFSIWRGTIYTLQSERYWCNVSNSPVLTLSFEHILNCTGLLLGPCPYTWLWSIHWLQ